MGDAEEPKNDPYDQGHRATYDPSDDKLRLYPAHRLSEEDYAAVKGAKMQWAPKQECFYGVWDPAREDVCTRFAGQIDDEDTTLVDRSEDRADRFEEYSDKRTRDYEQSRDAVNRLSSSIPMGQPILVGHHSEKHARKDAERIENGMRRAVKMWETAKYWQDRAAGAIRHAKYKERPDVRARRIKGLEADERKYLKNMERSEKFIRLWTTAILAKRKDGTDPDAVMIRARTVELANLDGCYWSSSIAHKSGYVGPMSIWEAAGGNTRGEDPETYAIATVDEIREKALSHHRGVIAYYTRWLDHVRNRMAYERAMLGEAGGIAADKTKPQKGGACKCWASPAGGWSKIVKVNKVSVSVLDNWGNGGPDFARTIPFDKLTALMTKEEVDAARADGRLISENDRGFGLLSVGTSEKRAVNTTIQHNDANAEVDAMKASLKAGVQVVAAPQLFPTPKAIVEMIIDRAQPIDGKTVLEPSAGTGAIVRGLLDVAEGGLGALGQVTAVELNAELVRALTLNFPGISVYQCDFLGIQPDSGRMGRFDLILMNPPFERGADLEHVQHALKFLADGGKLVAVMANSATRLQILRGMEGCGDYSIDIEPLPDGSFKDQGTNVRTVLVTITGN